MNKNLFNLNFIPYFFVGFMLLGLIILVTGVNITFWQQYQIMPVESGLSVSWFSIKRFDSNFWTLFRTIDNLYNITTWGDPLRGVFRFIPSIPAIPTFNTPDVGLLILDFLINIVNSFSTFINVVISVVNSVFEIVRFVVVFINTLAIFINNAGGYVHPIIY